MRLLIFPLLLGAGLLAPGWLLGRALRTPVGLSGAFLGSAALLLNLLLALDALDIELTGPHVATGLAVTCALLATIAKTRQISGPGGSSDTPPRALGWQRYHWLFVPAAIGLGAIAVSASLNPLSGLDTFFRWDFLARQMLREGSLHFYPAVTAENFLLYDWCDGIAPLVSSLYFWGYLSAGQTATWVTTPIVIAQGVLLFSTVYQLAARRAGPAAGCAAAAVLATSCIPLWGVAMGQETGLMALSLVAMFLFIENDRKNPGAHWLAWAGVAAGTAALAREYGPAFVVLGGLALAWRRVPRRGWVEFVLAAGVIALPWYLRTWIKTGNPFYSHDVAGLFPTNPVSAEYFRLVAEQRSLGTALSPLSMIAILFVRLTAVPLALGLTGIVAFRRECGAWLVAIVGVGTLWLWSLGQTSGGYVYSLRVLAPAVALAAVAGGMLAARWITARHGWVATALLTLLAVDAAERSLFMPTHPKIAWWRESPAIWRDAPKRFESVTAHPAWSEIATAAGGRKILVTDPFIHGILARLGAKPVPLFSPEVRFLSDPNVPYAACLARLRAKGVRFIVTTANPGVGNEQIIRHPFFRALRAAPAVMTPPTFATYDLYSPELTLPLPNAL